MTVADGNYKIHVHVGSELMEKILLNISPDCLDRVIGTEHGTAKGLGRAGAGAALTE